ncbi:MtrB/PioB family decaheme-associated outer membrane protein [Shewanella corallii]|uniref:MtrB/PioB family decaheme-associated outer membrane protein n=1 Tax=Shewanella corallii TaxID=560080 RepID=A0ABT0NA28_9GAMM|nr:MtrB/PioB family decaheme-associated outer membrane protein [Shewanella corallii]MCL2915225.1 MtrB/PioB family decaheme-associated outer membrane protein [Shewanella corallii]
MRFSLNLLTLALLSATGAVTAADFGIQHANTAKVKQAAYQCKQCKIPAVHTGSVTASLGYVDSSDSHAGNAFGTNDEGVVAGVDANVSYLNAEGYRSQLQAHQLGMDNGFVSARSGKIGEYKVELDYRNITTWQDEAQTQLWHHGGMLTPSESVRFVDLKLERQQAGLGFEYQINEDLNTYVRYDREDKTGSKSASLMSPRPINFAQPVDESTDKLSAGVVLSGANWMTDISYHGSQYKNNINHMSLPYAYDVYAATPDNQAHQLAVAGQYRLDATVLNGRVVAGRMIQDDNLIQVAGNPLQNWDGQVDTLDAKLAATSMLTPRLRVGGSVDYSKRDNDSSVYEFMQPRLSYDPLSNSFKQNTVLDIERQTVKLNTAYRLAQGYRLQAGYDYKQVERSYGEREQTRDNTLWAELDIRKFDTVRFEIKASHGIRGGSAYEASELTSSEEQSLLRKFNLADRNRTELELGTQYTPANWMSLDLTVHYAIDSFDERKGDDTVLGLHESRDYGYDLNLNLFLSDNLTAYGFAGQQWIDSEQAGDQANIWYADINDSFINLGAGVAYSGLLDDRLTVGADYLFANSNGETLVDANLTGSTSYGDYYSFNHSVELYGEYALSESMQLKLAYQYERFYDTDASEVGVDAITGLTTLGLGNHNYNAHQLMLSFSYIL